MIDRAAMGGPPTATDLLGAGANDLVEDWRAACTADTLVSGVTDTGRGDELAAERTRAVVGLTGPIAVEALVSLLRSPEQSEEAKKLLGRLAGTLAANNVGVGALVRQFSLLRQVLHRHAESKLSVTDVADVEGQLDRALDAVVEACVARAAERLEHDAFIDPLTGLFNRRALDRDLPREIAVAERHGRRLSLLTADVDGLKKINDRQGHTVGDGALRALAGALRAALRAGDSAYRVGGDEFVVLLPGMGPGDISQFITRIRSGAPPAFSWGAASLPDEVTNRPALLELADRRLLSHRDAAGSGREATTAAVSQQRTINAGTADRSHGRRALLLATFLGGVLIGGGSLASAATGTLPDGMQNVAHTVLGKVGVPVPSGKDRSPVKAARRSPPLERFLDDAGLPCTYPDGRAFTGTHGQFVAAHPDIATTPENEREQAARSRCGRPMAGAAAHDVKPEDGGRPDETGKPEVVGKPENGTHHPGTGGAPERPQGTRPQPNVAPRDNTNPQHRPTGAAEPKPQPPSTGEGSTATTAPTPTTAPAAVAPAEEPSTGPGRSSGRPPDRSDAGGAGGAGKPDTRSGQEPR